MPMALDERTAQAQLTPEERRELLRAFADRMLRKITAMDDPEDMPGVERAVRVAAVIERVYSRCDRAERQVRVEAPERHKLEAERATHEREAIKARVSLANTLKWGEERRLALGPWWDAAESVTKVQNPAVEAQVVSAPKEPPAQPTQTPVTHPLRSHTSGDATPAPNLATKGTAAKETGNARSGPSLRSSASEWPP